jgi:hypothetical protein
VAATASAATAGTGQRRAVTVWAARAMSLLGISAGTSRVAFLLRDALAGVATETRQNTSTGSLWFGTCAGRIALLLRFALTPVTTRTREQTAAGLFRVGTGTRLVALLPLCAGTVRSTGAVQ